MKAGRGARKWTLGTAAALFVVLLGVLVGFFRYYYPDLMLRDALNGDRITDVFYWAEHGGSARVRGDGGVTALHYAAAHAKVKLVRQLLEDGAEVDAITNSGETPLFWLSEGGIFQDGPERLATLHLLLDSGADAKVRDVGGKGALSGAASMGRFLIIQELLARGVDPNGGDADGWTALMHAAFSGYDPIVRVLIAHGADVSAQGRSGETALSLANRHPRVVATLRKAGAK